MKILVIGSKGQLGWELMNRASNSSFEVAGYDLPEFDVTDQEAAREVLRKGDFSVVVNASGYTAVDQAEEDCKQAFAVNCDGVAHLARACEEAVVPLVHVSTDYVFDGRSLRAYQEADPPSPLSVYGRSKAAGEREVERILRDYIIVRTAWLYGVHGRNFVKTILQLGKEREEIRVVADQLGCPTFAGDLADALFKVISALLERPSLNWRLYHYCGEGIVSWYEFAAEILKLARQYDRFPARLTPIPTVEFPTPAVRPAYSVLDCSRIKAQFGVRIRPWQESLAATLEVLFS